MEKEYMKRIEYLKNRVIAIRPEVDLEPAVLLTKSFKSTGGQPWVLRKAKGVKYQCENKSVTIWPKELIVGCSGSKIRGGIVSADSCWSVLDQELETISTRSYDPFFISEAEKEIFLREIKPFWEGRSIFEEWVAQIPEDVRNLKDNGAIFIDRKFVRGWGEVTAGYTDVINEGILSICRRIKEKMAVLDTTIPGDYEKEIYYKALLATAEGVIALAERYSAEAARLAATEEDAERRAELLEISRICAKVPAYPADSFYEAVQSAYLYHIVIVMEQNAASYNMGRMDQYLYPFYNADLEAGRITEEKAQELLDCLWVKLSEPCLFQDCISAQFSAGYPMFQNICAGGVDHTGGDAVNDLSYMLLQATMDVQLYQPSLSVRYSMAKNPNSFLKKVVELIKLGTGFPAFHCDEVGTAMMMNKGVPLREAYNWNPCGCVETNLEGKMCGFTAFADLNLGSMVELALLNGSSRKYGRFVSLETGDPTKFETYDEFEAAVKEQINYGIRCIVKGSHIVDYVSKRRPVPTLSLTHRECVENAVDYADGGAKYHVGNGIDMIGVADLINSLAAVKTLVFDEKKLSMRRLLGAMADNFANEPEIHKLCLDAPKYGNDIGWGDRMGAELFTYIADEIESYKSHRGTMSPGILPVSGNTPFGLEVGALPSGRVAWKPLSDGLSPMCGTDMEGPTAILKSISKIPHDRFMQGTLLNMKIMPDFLDSEDGVAAMMSLLKGLCSLGVFHVQFNVVDQEKLLDAQRHPENYKGLLVRVAGYTAFFVELDKNVQDDIIARTTIANVA
ncbi:glycyl radical protein [Cloacibacillus porcorum]|uniref:glycyl radical protein n=1 Tax=Cloacibacillus porcorum TaxID=1197717 RepID=UPI0022E6B203|nr:formate C-acetyltransferase/glycerol dehydratase family glycyl radical enzyme [Cloacibacillus porcorum]